MNLEYQAFQFAKSKHPSNLVADIRQLWKALTVDRSESLSDYFRKPGLRRAYLGYYMPLYAVKIARLLDSLNLPFKAPRVLDLGAGPLSATLGAYLSFGELGKVMAVDQDLGPMRSGLEFFEGVLGDKKMPDIKLVRSNLKGPPQYWKPDFEADLILMAHVLNEFGEGERHIEEKQQLIVHAVNRLAPNGVLLIIEPASRLASRDIMWIRNWLYESGQVEILAPCPPKVPFCPLLASRSNWCHAEIPHIRPQELFEIDRKIGFDREFLKCSYLAIARRDSGYKSKTDCRIVSGLMNADGVLRRYACTPNGLLTLSQHQQDPIQILSKMIRGDATDPKRWPRNVIKVTKE
ncbi:MAG: small ribosomal subunit Rsm22 family protein [Myxococcota bacterium]